MCSERLGKIFDRRLASPKIEEGCQYFDETSLSLLPQQPTLPPLNRLFFKVSVFQYSSTLELDSGSTIALYPLTDREKLGFLV